MRPTPPPAPPPTATGIARAPAKARSAKMPLLLAAPLVAVFMGGVFSFDFPAMIASALAMGGYWSGAKLISQGLQQKHSVRWFSKRLRAFPSKLAGSALIGLSSGVVAWSLAGMSGVESLAYVAGAGIGSLLYYGLDPVSTSEPNFSAFDDADYLRDVLRGAEQRVLAIEQANLQISNGEFSARLNRICDQAHEVIDLLAENPRDIRRAKRFLNVYLEGAERVATGYAKAHQRVGDHALDDNFREVLGTIETTFAEQKQRLLADEALDLDIQIEVLKKQMEREGVS